jgi:hypothetical protein
MKYEQKGRYESREREIKIGTERKTGKLKRETGQNERQGTKTTL